MDELDFFYFENPERILTPENTTLKGLIVLPDENIAELAYIRNPLNGKLMGGAIGVWNVPSKDINYAPETDSGNVFIDS